MEKSLKHQLTEIVKEIAQSETIDSIRLEKLDRAISIARKRGIDVHVFESALKCYRSFLFDDYGFYKSFGVCEDLPYNQGEVSITALCIHSFIIHPDGLHRGLSTHPPMNPIDYYSCGQEEEENE